MTLQHNSGRHLGPMETNQHSFPPVGATNGYMSKRAMKRRKQQMARNLQDLPNHSAAEMDNSSRMQFQNFTITKESAPVPGQLDSYVKNLLDSFDFGDSSRRSRPPSAQSDHNNFREEEEDDVELIDFPSRIAHFQNTFNDTEMGAQAIAVPVAPEDNLKKALEDIQRRQRKSEQVPGPSTSTSAAPPATTRVSKNGVPSGAPSESANKSERSSSRNSGTTNGSKPKRQVIEAPSNSDRKVSTKKKSTSPPSRRRNQPSPPRETRRVILEPNRRSPERRNGETRRVTRRNTRSRSRSRSRSPHRSRRTRKVSRSRSRSPRGRRNSPSPEYAGRRYLHPRRTSHSPTRSSNNRRVVERPPYGRGSSRSRSPERTVKRFKSSSRSPKREDLDRRVERMVEPLEPVVINSTATSAVEPQPQLFTKGYIAAAVTAANQATTVVTNQTSTRFVIPPSTLNASAQFTNFMHHQQVQQMQQSMPPPQFLGLPQQTPFPGPPFIHLQQQHNGFLGHPMMPPQHLQQQQNSLLGHPLTAQVNQQHSNIMALPSPSVAPLMSLNLPKNPSPLISIPTSGASTSTTVVQQQASTSVEQPPAAPAVKPKAGAQDGYIMDQRLKMIHETRNLQTQRADLDLRLVSIPETERDALNPKYSNNGRLMKAMITSARGFENRLLKNMTMEELVKLEASRKQQHYGYFIPEHLWCQPCGILVRNLSEYLIHLHSEKHNEKLKSSQPAAPWRKQMTTGSKESDKAADMMVPADGFGSIVPVKAFYCELCHSWMGDKEAVESHMKSSEHNDAALRNFMEKTDLVMKQVENRQLALSRHELSDEEKAKWAEKKKQEQELEFKKKQEEELERKKKEAADKLAKEKQEEADKLAKEMRIAEAKRKEEADRLAKEKKDQADKLAKEKKQQADKLAKEKRIAEAKRKEEADMLAKEKRIAEAKKKKEEQEKRMKKLEENRKTFLEKEKTLSVPVMELEDAQVAKSKSPQKKDPPVKSQSIRLNIRTPLTSTKSDEVVEANESEPANSLQLHQEPSSLVVNGVNSAELQEQQTDGIPAEVTVGNICLERIRKRLGDAAMDQDSRESGECTDSETEQNESITAPVRSSDPINGTDTSTHSKRPKRTRTQTVDMFQEVGEGSACALPQNAVPSNTGVQKNLGAKQKSSINNVIPEKISEVPMDQDEVVPSSGDSSLPTEEASNQPSLPESMGEIEKLDRPIIEVTPASSTVVEPQTPSAPMEAVEPEKSLDGLEINQELHVEVDSPQVCSEDFRPPEISPLPQIERKIETRWDITVKKEDTPLTNNNNDPDGYESDNDCLVLEAETVSVPPSSPIRAPSPPIPDDDDDDCCVVDEVTKEMKTKVIDLIMEEDEDPDVTLRLPTPVDENTLSLEGTDPVFRDSTPIQLCDFIVLSETGADDNSPDAGNPDCAPSLTPSHPASTPNVDH